MLTFHNAAMEDFLQRQQAEIQQQRCVMSARHMARVETTMSGVHIEGAVTAHRWFGLWQPPGMLINLGAGANPDIDVRLIKGPA